jgi:hypothetical protein
MAEKCTSIITGMPHGGSSTREDTYVKLIELSHDINDKIDALVNMQVEIEAAIDTVPDLTLQTLLRYRYVHGMKWKDVSTAMNYEYEGGNVFKLHGEALEL